MFGMVIFSLILFKFEFEYMFRYCNALNVIQKIFLATNNIILIRVKCFYFDVRSHCIVM